MKLLPEWRKAGKQIGGKLAQFGTIDCAIHKPLCQQVYTIKIYVTLLDLCIRGINKFAFDLVYSI